jgi:hypothetical protein
MKYFLTLQLKEPFDENIPKIRAVSEARRKQGIGLSELAERGELKWVLPFHLMIAEQKMIAIIDIDDPNIVWKWLMDHGIHATIHATQIIERKQYVEKFGDI